MTRMQIINQHFRNATNRTLAFFFALHSKFAYSESTQILNEVYKS